MKKHYIDTDVYVEAKKRIRHVIDSFDTVVVCFSGGKDSLCTLHLVGEVYDELGIKDKVKVIFRDEELIPDDVINFVRSYAESGRYDFRYFAVPLKSQKFILGKSYEYIQWDRNRKWLREPPFYAIRLPEGDNRVFDQYSMDTFSCEGYKGRIALVNGIRADESLLRLNSSCVKKNENYINATKDPRIKMVKPIFDWTENDIFLYFYKNKIKYCYIYDLQTLNGDKLRVSTPLHAESAKNIHKLATLYPTFYQQLVDIFPDILTQAMYYSQLDRSAASFEGYEPSIEGIKKYAEDTIDDKKYLQMALNCIEIAGNQRNRRMNTKTYGGFPLLHIIKSIQNGAYKRGRIMPTCNVTKEAEILEQKHREWMSR